MYECTYMSLPRTEMLFCIISPRSTVILDGARYSYVDILLELISSPTCSLSSIVPVVRLQSWQGLVMYSCQEAPRDRKDSSLRRITSSHMVMKSRGRHFRRITSSHRVMKSRGRQLRRTGVRQSPRLTRMSKFPSRSHHIEGYRQTRNQQVRRRK
jgi:hypothetical protein